MLTGAKPQCKPLVCRVVYNDTETMASSNYKPPIQIRCSDCGRVHTDERFSICRECGSLL